MRIVSAEKRKDIRALLIKEKSGILDNILHDPYNNE